MKKNINSKKILDKEKSPPPIEELNKNILKLNKSFESANSFKLTIVRGILSGVGTAIGATIIAAIVITILVKTIHTVRDIPIVGDIIEKTQVERFINVQKVEKP